ncbi:purine permease, partial [Escherichia coli]|nr:purine permease [Escherichia coli]MDW6084414.1 purine permease [Escherichia coli]
KSILEKTLTRWPVFVDHFIPAVLQPLLHSGIMLATLSAVVLNVFFNGYQHHADLVKESVSDKDLKVRTVRMWLLMRKLKKNEHGE